jgi:hypothetical protein
MAGFHDVFCDLQRQRKDQSNLSDNSGIDNFTYD